jgi:hypothetical protein
MVEDHGGFHPVYMIELSAGRPLEIDDRGFYEELAAGLGSVDVGATGEGSLYLLRDFPIQLSDANICAQIAVLRTKINKPPPNVEEAIGQSWQLPDARARLARMTHSVLLHDLMSSALDHRQRRKILSVALRSLLRHSNAELAYILPTQQFMDARDLLAQLDQEGEVRNPVAGFLNVRFFNISGTDGEMLMDTLGLTALDLADFQIHYRKLDPKAVAGFLYTLGSYIFEKGPVIENGHTVQGVEKGSKWRCRLENSLLSPRRGILDLDPGPEFAAGNRSR